MFLGILYRLSRKSSSQGRKHTSLFSLVAQNADGMAKYKQPTLDHVVIRVGHQDREEPESPEVRQETAPGLQQGLLLKEEENVSWLVKSRIF